MTKIYKIAGALLLASISILQIKAQVIFNEPFVYSTGDLQGNNAGTGFSSAWSNATTGNTGANSLAQIVAGKIDPSSTSPSTGNKLQVTLPSGATTTVRYDRTIPLTLNGDASTQSYWLGYWLRIPAANLSASTYGVTAQMILMNAANSTVATDMRFGYGKTSNFSTGVNSANALTMFTRASPGGCAALNWPSGWNTSTAAQQTLIGLSTTTDNVVYVLVKITKGEFIGVKAASTTTPNPNTATNFDGFRMWFLSAPPTSTTDPIFTTYPNGFINTLDAETGINFPIQTKMLRTDLVPTNTCTKDGVTGIRIRVEGNPGVTTFLAEFDEIKLGNALGDIVVLPITLQDFSANQLGKNNIINWQTATENNNKGFSVEQSENGNTWKSIGFVQGNTNSSIKLDYNFIDNNPFDITYYRLRQEDINGKITYTKIVKVKRSNSISLEITPNPAQESINIVLNKVSNNNTITIVDARGRKVNTSKFNGYRTTIDIGVLAKGIYFVNIVTENGTSVEKFIKN
jgi:hypothetical protein